MKNKIIIALILIATSAYSQKIGTIDYGNNLWLRGNGVLT